MSFVYAGQWGPDSLTTPGGFPLDNFTVTINVHGGGLATLYTDRTKATGAANPTTTDAKGNLVFYADPGDYDIVGNGATLQVSIGTDPSEPVTATNAATQPPLDNSTKIATTAYTDTAVAVETSRAETAEGTKATAAALTAETSRAEAAEATNATAISTETTRAEAAEALALPKTGGTMSGAIAMGANKVTNLANGSGAQDAAAFGQIPTALPPNGSAGGDLSGSYPNPNLKATGPGATGPIGDGTHVSTVTIDAEGRVTALSSTAITGGPPSGSAGGDLTGSYPNPTLGTAGPGATGPIGSSSVAPVVTIDAKGRVTGLTSANINRTSVFMVAANNAPTAHKNGADYLCSGTGDQSTINTAIVAAAAVGGTVLLSEGTFNLTNSCVFGNGSGTQYNNVQVIGQGKGTIVSAAFSLQTVAGPFTNQTVTNTSRTVNLTSATGVFLGQLVTDSGGLIPANTVVENISGTTLTLSNAATGSSSTDTLTFQSYGVYPIFDVYDQTSSGTNPVNGCTFRDMTLTTPTPNTVSAVNITGLPGGSRNQASRSLACGVYLSGSDHVVRDIKFTNLQIGVVTDIWNRFSTIQTTATDGAVTATQPTVTSATLAPIAAIGDTLTVSGQTGGQNTQVVGYITEINLSTNVMTLDVTMLTTVASGGTVVLTPSGYGLGRAARNWLENLDCYNLWAGAVGNWTEQNHVEGVTGLFVESVMADKVGSSSPYGGVSPSVALYYDGQNGNNHISLQMTDVEMTNNFYSGSSPSGTSVSGTTITGTGFTPAMNGMFAFAVAGTGVIPPYATVAYASSTMMTLSQPATTNGTITTLVLSQGDYRGHTIKMGGVLRGIISQVRSYGNPLLIADDVHRYVHFSDMSCLSGTGLIFQVPDPQSAGSLNSFMRECTFSDISIDYDQSSQGGNVSSLTGVNNTFRDFVITTNWQTASTNSALYIQGQNNIIDGVLINHRGATAPGINFISNQGGNAVRNIRGINVTNLLQSNSGNSAASVNNVAYDPGETILSGSPTTPLAGTSTIAGVIPWNYNIAPTQLTVSQGGGGTKNPDFTACTTYLLNVTDGTPFTIGQPYPQPITTSGLLPIGMRIRVMVKNASGGAMGAITWNSGFVFITPWINPANGNYCSADFESDGLHWIQVASEGSLDSSLLTAPFTQYTAAGYTSANLGWTFDPIMAQNGWQPTGGVIYLTRVKCLVGGLCGHIAYDVEAAGSVLTSTENLIGLYDTGQIAAGSATLIGLSGDQSAVWTTAGTYQTAITAQGGHSLTLVAGQDYYVAILAVGTTIPKFIAAENSSALGGTIGTLLNLNTTGTLGFRTALTAGGQTTLTTPINHSAMSSASGGAPAAILTT